jgi:hypothetical protein
MVPNQWFVETMDGILENLALMGVRRTKIVQEGADSLWIVFQSAFYQ